MELDHLYGDRVHILSSPYLLSLLARLCSPDTHQPEINRLISGIYTALFTHVAAREFPVDEVSVPTRMQANHPKEGIYRGPAVKRDWKAITVNLARAGTLPSHIVYEHLHDVLPSTQVRQDHISISRCADLDHRVTGSSITGHKIGGPIDDAILIIPDPMAATGSTVLETLQLYRPLGKARKTIAIHCIVTPEYLMAMKNQAPDVIIYSARLDRGLSPADVLNTVPGTHWGRERGLNDRQYIVPGGGGFGEILNNAYV